MSIEKGADMRVTDLNMRAGAHVAVLDEDGVVEYRCLAAPGADCWRREDELGNIVSGYECQLIKDISALRGEVMIGIEVEYEDVPNWASDAEAPLEVTELIAHLMQPEL
jgi:hypothetical protein